VSRGGTPSGGAQEGDKVEKTRVTFPTTVRPGPVFRLVHRKVQWGGKVKSQTLAVIVPKKTSFGGSQSYWGLQGHAEGRGV